MTRRGLSIFLAALVLAVAQQPATAPHVSEYPSPLVREEQEVTVDQRKEIWQLVWSSAPEPYCGVKELSLNCPCMGFAYGEAGDLSVARLREGAEVDRLSLAPVFSYEHDKVAVQRWPVDQDKDFRDPEDHDLPHRITQRPVMQVMQFGNYDHDSADQEFYLQTTTQPCGKSSGIVVGMSRKLPRLHVVTTAAHPERPLVLFKHEWEALRDAKVSPVDLLDWPCGDHGAETEMRVVLRWGPKGLDGSRREYSCPAPGNPKKLLRSDAL